MDWILRHKAISIIIAIAIAVAGWYFFGSSSPQSVLSIGTADLPPGAQTLVNNLNTLQAIKLDGSFFSSPAFQSLKDFTTQIQPEPVGRPDPFAPIQPSQTASAPSAQAARLFAPAAPGH